MSARRWRQFANVFAITLGIFLAAGACRAADLAGCWEGTWKSCTSGHHGKLKAQIVKLDENRYCCRFSGTFFMVLPFQYSVILTAEPGDDVLTFMGRSNLGRLAGGTYRYTGHADDCKFHATYRSCKDQGVFDMRRVCH